MRRLTHMLRTRTLDLKREESGISLIFVTLSLVVLVGLVAFAVDTGALYQERRELQNGADAAAIAIAEDCALGAQPCTQAQADATASAFADANAGDLKSAVDGVVLDTGAKTVSVAVSTETASGGSIFRPFFAQVIGFDGATVHADAAAAWGYPSGLATLPLIISQCEWDREADSGDNLHPNNPLPPVGTPTLLTFHAGNNAADDCNAQAGQDWDGDDRMPGGFGWLDAVNCQADVDYDSWVSTDPGSSPSNSCSASYFKNEVLNHVVFVPWFNDLRGNGSNGEFHIAGFGAFYVTGYNFGGQYKEPMGNTPCSGSVRCLEGYFIETTITDGDTGGPDFGTVVVKFTE